MKLKTADQNLKARFNEEFCQGNRKRRKRNLVFSPLDSVLWLVNLVACCHTLTVRPITALIRVGWYQTYPTPPPIVFFLVLVCLSDAYCIYLLLYLKHGPLRKQRNNFEICSCTLKISIPPCSLFPLKFEKNNKKII